MESSEPHPASDSWPESLLSELAVEVLEISPDAVVIATPDGSLSYLNGTGRLWRGLGARQPLAGLTLSGLFPDWAWQVIAQEGVPQALEHGAWSGELAALRAGPGEVPVLVRLVIFGRAGQRWLAAIMRDLSDARRLEMERIEMANRYESALRMSGHVMLDWEPFTGSLACTGDCPALLGTEPGMPLAHMDMLRALIHPADLSSFDREIQRTVSRRMPLTVVFRVRNARGEFHAVRAAGGYYLDRSGRYGRVTAILSNAETLRTVEDELDRLRQQAELNVEEQVREARLEAQMARQAKSEFLSRMSHELRTPLNAILGFTQLLELEGATPEQKESIEHIARAGQHLLALVNGVLDLTRTETGRLPMNLHPVSLSACLNEALELSRAALAEARVTLHFDPAWPDVQVRADRLRLRQVLLRILGNAARFNSPGGQVQVTCALLPDHRVRVSVADTGPGIPPEKLGTLFNSLERTGEPLNQGGGAGLGLALSRGLMRAMGGELGVRSTVGEGSTFWLELAVIAVPPPVTPGEPEPISPPPLPPAPPAPPKLRPVTLLYVDDEEANVLLVRRILADYPQYDLVWCAEGKQAVAAAEARRPDLILLDLHLGEVSGEDVLIQVRQTESLRDIPIIMVTSDYMEQHRERLLRRGATACLPRPFRISEFIRLLRDTLHPGAEGGQA